MMLKINYNRLKIQLKLFPIMFAYLLNPPLNIARYTFKSKSNFLYMQHTDENWEQIFKRDLCLKKDLWQTVWFLFSKMWQYKDLGDFFSQKRRNTIIKQTLKYQSNIYPTHNVLEKIRHSRAYFRVNTWQIQIYFFREIQVQSQKASKGWHAYVDCYSPWQSIQEKTK